MTATIKQRPILFNGEMVRAILDGRKTQTRRLINPTPMMITDGNTAPWSGDSTALMRLLEQSKRLSPYGKVGDQLYVRETWAQPGTLDPRLTVYLADYPACVPIEHKNIPPPSAITWKPSIHMPRSASRITLEIIGVRVERLHHISHDDACEEGIGNTRGGENACIERFKNIWTSTGGDWDANPWVWVYEFKRVEA